MRPSAPNLQCLLPEWLLSRFLPHTRHNRGTNLARLWAELMQSRLVFSRDRVTIDHCSKLCYWSATWHSEPPFIWCLPIRPKILNVSQIAVTFHGIRPPFFIQTWFATVQQKSLLSLCALLIRQSHLFLICVVLTYNDSRIIHRKICQIPRNCRCEWLLVSSSAPRTSLGSSGSPEKFLFHMARIVTTALPNLVPPRHIDDCYAIHLLHRESWSAAIKSPKFSALGTTVPVRLLHEALVIFVLEQISQFGSFGKCVYTLCLPEPSSTFARDSCGNSWEELEVSRYPGSGLPVDLKDYVHQPNCP